MLWLEDGKPLTFGAENPKGIRLDGNKPEVVELGDKWGEDDLLVHDKTDYVIASLLANMTYLPEFPDPIGVFYSIQSPTYEDMLTEQIGHAIKNKPKASVKDLLNSGDTWTVK